jgi:phage baseplate assembly protein W
MASFAVKLPITRNSIDGFTMIKDFKTLISQNLKMLVLTDPGERVMDPEYGVGARAYLFSNFSTTVYVDIETNIKNQVAKYMPMVSIKQIEFDKRPGTIDQNTLAMRIVYRIPAINITEMLEFTI